MFRYISFFIKCILGKITFFKLSLAQQAQVLQKYKLYYLAGKYYLGLENFHKAAYCFKRCNAHKQLMMTYIQLELPSKAIEIAEKHGFYKEGASLCEAIANPQKAAFFYSHFEPQKAAKLYKKQGLYFQAGACYLQAYQFNMAVDCFNACQDSSKKFRGLRQVEEIAITLYFKKSYELAAKLFIKLGDYESALICAKQMKQPALVKQLHSYAPSLEKLPT